MRKAISKNYAAGVLASAMLMFSATPLIAGIVLDIKKACHDGRNDDVARLIATIPGAQREAWVWLDLALADYKLGRMSDARDALDQSRGMARSENEQAIFVALDRELYYQRTYEHLMVWASTPSPAQSVIPAGARNKDTDLMQAMAQHEEADRRALQKAAALRPGACRTPGDDTAPALKVVESGTNWAPAAHVQVSSATAPYVASCLGYPE